MISELKTWPEGLGRILQQREICVNLENSRKMRIEARETWKKS
jgi:hypothetical protein